MWRGRCVRGGGGMVVMAFNVMIIKKSKLKKNVLKALWHTEPDHANQILAGQTDTRAQARSTSRIYTPTDTYPPPLPTPPHPHHSHWLTRTQALTLARTHAQHTGTHKYGRKTRCTWRPVGVRDAAEEKTSLRSVPALWRQSVWQRGLCRGPLGLKGGAASWFVACIGNVPALRQFPDYRYFFFFFFFLLLLTWVILDTIL